MRFPISTRMGIATASLGAALAFTPANAGTAKAASAMFDQVIVFGDSLSDVGNVGRATDGYLWDEHVAGAYGLKLLPSSQGGTDYAYGGAHIDQDVGKTPSLPTQVNTYLTANPKADAKALYVIWGGGTDVFATEQDPGSATSVIDTGVADTIAMIRTLYKAGGRTFVIGNIPRTDLTPHIQVQGAQVVAQQAAVVLQWNKQLLAALQALSLPGAQILQYNAAGWMRGIFVSPTHFGFTDLTTPCDGTCADPDHTFFYDMIHPGSTGHSLTGGEILSLLRQKTD